MKFSVFDLDRTLLAENSSFEFCKYLYREKIFSLSYILQSVLYSVRHKYLGLTLEQLHHKVFKKLLKGTDIRTLQDYTSRFLDAEFERMIYPPALERLRRAQHEGHFTMILSNSPSFLVSAIASKLQVDEWRSSEYSVDKDQKLCKIASILHGEAKARWVRTMSHRLGILRREITAYSDSYLDLPFLQSAGVAIVVNPDSKLKKISQGRCWEEI